MLLVVSIHDYVICAGHVIKMVFLENDAVVALQISGDPPLPCAHQMDFLHYHPVLTICAVCI